MTNEEIINRLDEITSFCDFTDVYGDLIDSTPYHEALDLAIKALEQPCEDCISREDAINVAIDAVDEWDGGCNTSRATMISNAIKDLPSVTPQQTIWIPVSERLPEEDGVWEVQNDE